MQPLKLHSFSSLFTTLIQSWQGALLCSVIALAASFVSHVHGGPALLYALLLGIAFHFLFTDPKIKPGIDFCAGTLLRIGVALLGARITITQVVSLGWQTAFIVVFCVFATVTFGIWLARQLGMGLAQGVLSGGATAICGASAALAISAVLPRSREQENFTLLVVLVVTTLSTIAMLLYPLLAQALQLSSAKTGLFLGGSIHDVAQVVGAGYLMGPTVGDTATVVKLFRVSLLALVVGIIAIAFRAKKAHQQPSVPHHKIALVPWFLWVFAAFVLLNSFFNIPDKLTTSVNEISKSCLLIAITALGVKTSLPMLLQTGWRPLVLLLTETLWLAGLLLLSIFVL
jgi:uncharacterized integral membrane protein (TIGR00698 family)